MKDLSSKIIFSFLYSKKIKIIIWGYGVTWHPDRLQRKLSFKKRKCFIPKKSYLER